MAASDEREIPVNTHSECDAEFISSKMGVDVAIVKEYLALYKGWVFETIMRVACDVIVQNREDLQVEWIVIEDHLVFSRCADVTTKRRKELTQKAIDIINRLKCPVLGCRPPSQYTSLPFSYESQQQGYVFRPLSNIVRHTTIRDVAFDESDVNLVITQTGCTYEKAKTTLKDNHGDVVKSIMRLTKLGS